LKALVSWAFRVSLKDFFSWALKVSLEGPRLKVENFLSDSK
jgi:hypothetical protein